MKVIIFLDHLRAVALAQAVKDVRYYLNGVFIETNGRDYFLVATDGHRMHIAKGFDAEGTVSAPSSIIIPSDAIKQVIAAGKKSGFVTIEFEQETRSGHATVLPWGLVIPFVGIERTLPIWRRSVPKEYTAENVGCYHIKGNYLADVKRAFAFIDCKCPPAPLIASDKDSMPWAVMFAANGLTCIVMPINPGKIGYSIAPCADEFILPVPKPETKEGR